MIQIIAEQNPHLEIKHGDIARRIENIVYTYDKRDLDEYLIGMAHNFELQR